MSVDPGTRITIWSVVSLLAGTVVSSIVAYVLQRSSFAEARRLKAQDKFDERKSLGLNVYHKTIRIASTLQVLKSSIVEGLSRPITPSPIGGPWQTVMPIANFPGRVNFTSEERTFLMLLDPSIFNDLGPYDDIHNSIIDMFETYRARRQAFTDTLPAEMKGNLGSTEFTRDQLLLAAPRAAELTVLVEAMAQRTSVDSDEAWMLLDRLQDALNKEFKLALRLERKPLP